MATDTPTPGWDTPADLTVGPAPGIRFASPAARLIAYIIDVVIVSVVSLAVFAVLGVIAAAAGSAGADVIAGLGIIIAFLVWLAFTFAYFPYFWAKSGQTPGMRTQHIKVVRDADGGPVTGASAVVRLVGYWINGIVFYIGYIWILVDKRRRGWHDLIAGTCVIEA